MQRIRNGTIDQPELKEWNMKDCGKWTTKCVKTGIEYTWIIV